ncbi:carboxypeptidase M32 [Marinobacterium nitratireducens]|uniref:Metal-dependent carboxypeptidase n=1 Tax=Marinobacterium nitratireducens TaxID=518897 RepID=A0A918DNS6_9GAMM|nr:carboxypeptidase M32 [Marinobacterium nitratireducens]GGO77414.1 carboxypeptidase M32 [Marinobacterium nitratireducens]
MSTAYQQLLERFRELHRFAHLEAICHWDQSTMMPSGSNEARSEALAELALMQHRRLTAPEVGDWIAQADGEVLAPLEQANLREMKRHWQQAIALPDDLVEAQSLAGARCEHAWREQRRSNDWRGFSGNLREVVRLCREEADVRSAARGGGRYDSLLDLYEPGMTRARLDALFAEIGGWLPDLCQRVIERQSSDTCLSPVGPFPTDAQRKLGLEVMSALGFDFDRGRLDVSVHPFCGGAPEDVRITTRYSEDDFSGSLMGVIHETGHGCYEQNLPPGWLGQPAGEARSMGVHESQSLLFEMQLARHPAFLHWIAPRLLDAFGHEGQSQALAPDNLQKLFTRVQPGLIRVDADEVTYPFHIILRYEIECGLIEGELEVEDIPELWNEKMEAWLGLSTRGNYRDGCMQDIHWTDGSFGYFPTYTLGAIYAAQLFAALEREIEGLEQHIRDGNFVALTCWLREKIWLQGSLLETDELLRQATGDSPDPDWLRRHLERRYLAVD